MPPISRLPLPEIVPAKVVPLPSRVSPLAPSDTAPVPDRLPIASDAPSCSVPPVIVTMAVSAMALPPESSSVPSAIVHEVMLVGAEMVQVPLPDLVALPMFITSPSVAEPLPVSVSVSLPPEPPSSTPVTIALVSSVILSLPAPPA